MRLRSRRPLSEQPLISMQLSSNSSSSGGGGTGASTHGSGQEQLPAPPPDPPKDVESAFGSVIFEPGARPGAALKGSSPAMSSLGGNPIEEGEEGQPGTAARPTPAGGLSLEEGDSQYGSPADTGFPPGDEAGADSRRGSAPSVPPLSPQATPGARCCRVSDHFDRLVCPLLRSAPLRS